jgi:hypothetical protein
MDIAFLLKTGKQTQKNGFQAGLSGIMRELVGMTRLFDFLNEGFYPFTAKIVKSEK